MAGIACPGYDDKKPLKWLAPGKVLSRTRQRKDLTASKDRAINSKDETDQGDNNQSLIRVERNNIEIITHLELRSETCDIAQAAHYCKSPSHAALRTVAMKARSEP